MSDSERATFFERLKKGMQDSIAYSKGELTLRTITPPPPPPSASPQRVVKLRRKLGMSQAVFAATLNISPKLVQSWEQGLRKPDRGALRLLQIIEARPGIVAEVLKMPSTPSPRKRRKVA